MEQWITLAWRIIENRVHLEPTGYVGVRVAPDSEIRSTSCKFEPVTVGLDYKASEHPSVIAGKLISKLMG
jgi:hypothetical protein